MSLNWIRACTLIVDGRTYTYDPDDAGAGGLRIRFKVHQHTNPTPNSALIRVTNVARSTPLPKKGAEVTLIVGYKNGPKGVIYHGNLIQAFKGKESPTDLYLDVNCGEGDRAHNHAVANKSLPAGSTGKDAFDVAMKEFQKFNVSLGPISPKALAALQKLKYPRAQAFFGMAREIFHNLAHTTGSTWSVQKGKLQFVEKEETVGGPVKLNSQTGLIGMPVETNDGIIIRCLINPSLNVNDQVEVDQASINRALVTPNIGYELQEKALELLGTADGVYKILAIEWEGDTRGQDWYATLTCYGAKTGEFPGSQLGGALKGSGTATVGQ
jgi:hypothetical protein